MTDSKPVLRKGPLPPVPDADWSTREWLIGWAFVLSMTFGPAIILMVAMSL